MCSAPLEPWSQDKTEDGLPHICQFFFFFVVVFLLLLALFQIIFLLNFFHVNPIIIWWFMKLIFIQWFLLWLHKQHRYYCCYILIYFCWSNDVLLSFKRYSIISSFSKTKSFFFSCDFLDVRCLKAQAFTEFMT